MCRRSLVWPRTSQRGFVHAGKCRVVYETQRAERRARRIKGANPTRVIADEVTK